MGLHARSSRSRTFTLGVGLALGIALGSPGRGAAAEQAPAPPPSSAPHGGRTAQGLDARLAGLARGINLSHWFAQVRDGGYTPEHLATHTTSQDLALIRSLRFDHVRLSVDPAPLWTADRPERLPPEHLGRLTRAIREILGHDLSVVVDIHPSSDFKRRLQTDARHVEAFADFWRSLAAHLAATDPERVFLEVLNEPEFTDPYRWAGVQARVVGAIRQGAPRHTVIVTGHQWSAIDELLVLEPLADPNVIYSFHVYVPHLFTHQGATWSLPFWRHLRNVPYPSSPQGLEPLASTAPDDLTRLRLIRYGHERWSAERIEAEIGEAAAWARRRGVRLVCSEFGVTRGSTDPAHRAQWIADVRAALERHGVGWTLWDYAGDFGIVTKEGGQVTPEERLLSALGLRD